jgi:hypothetical protein
MISTRQFARVGKVVSSSVPPHDRFARWRRALLASGVATG